MLAWIGAAFLILVLHASFVFWLTRRPAADDSASTAPAVMIELAPLEATAPAETTMDVAPGPQMTEATPEEVEPPETITVPDLAPAPKPEAVLVAAPKPKPKPKPKKVETVTPKPVVKQTHEPPAPRTTAPVRSGATQAASAARQGNAGSSMSSSQWGSQVRAILVRHKPGGMGVSGVVGLSFSVSPSGAPYGARISRSSGSASLDQAALGMVRSAGSFPPPPPQGPNGVTIAINFHP